MKKTIIKKSLLLIVSIACLGSLSAQERLKRVLERCEVSPHTKVISMTDQKGSGGQAAESITKTIVIEGDRALIDEVIAAFHADKGAAGSVSENSTGGELSSFRCTFEADGMTSTYQLNRRENGGAVLIFTQQPKGIRFSDTNMVIIDGMRIQADSIRANIRSNFDSEQIDSIKRELARTMEEYKSQLQEAMRRLQEQLQSKRENR